MIRIFVPATLLALAGCGSASQAPAPAPTASPSATPMPAGTPSPTSSPSMAAPTSVPVAEASQDLAALDSRDCRTVIQAYADAVARNDFDSAARLWNDPANNATRLKALFTAYAVPHIQIAKVEEEGAAGSLYCTVTGKLTDVANPNAPAQSGEIVLRRVNDVPGATPEQLRWTIQSSTFVEKIARSAKRPA